MLHDDDVESVASVSRSAHENREPLRRSRSKSVVWNHFEKINPQQAKCKLCGKVFALKYSNTSGILRHLKSSHTQIPLESQAQPVTVQTVVHLDENSPRAKQLTEGVARMIALDLQPYSIVDDIGFRFVMNIAEPGFKIPSRTNMSRIVIPRMYDSLKENIRSKIHEDIQEGNLLL